MDEDGKRRREGVKMVGIDGKKRRTKIPKRLSKTLLTESAGLE